MPVVYDCRRGDGLAQIQGLYNQDTDDKSPVTLIVFAHMCGRLATHKKHVLAEDVALVALDMCSVMRDGVSTSCYLDYSAIRRLLRFCDNEISERIESLVATADPQDSVV